MKRNKNIIVTPIDIKENYSSSIFHRSSPSPFFSAPVDGKFKSIHVPSIVCVYFSEKTERLT